MVLNMNMISPPPGDADQNLPRALKSCLNGWKICTSAVQTHDARGNKSRLLLLPGTQKPAAAAASRNDWKLAQGWMGCVGAFTGDFYRGTKPRSTNSHIQKNWKGVCVKASFYWDFAYVRWDDTVMLRHSPRGMAHNLTTMPINQRYAKVNWSTGTTTFNMIERKQNWGKN